MFPIRDNLPSRRFPVVATLLVAANVAVFLYQVSLEPRSAIPFIYRFGVVPAAVSKLLSSGGGGLDVLVGGDSLGFCLCLPIDPYHVGRSLLASMFLHGGLLHLAGNMWFLWIFGDNVEDRLGRTRFLLFYLLCGFGAAAVHVATHPESTAPVIGASGAIAGVLGAYMVMFPRAKIVTAVFMIFILFVEVPAFFYLGIWFLLQVVASAGGDGVAGGVAFWAHVGGFLVGILLLPIFLGFRSGRG